MRKNRFKLIALVFLVQLGLPCVTRPAAAQAEKAPYPAMAPVAWSHRCPSRRPAATCCFSQVRAVPHDGRLRYVSSQVFPW
jgi:hypothetical protein